MIGGLGGDLLVALLTAGAFAAFLATSSGLTIAVAGVISQDVVSKRVEGVTAFRVSAVVAVVVPFTARAAHPRRRPWPPWSGSPSRWRPRPSHRC